MTSVEIVADLRQVAPSLAASIIDSWADEDREQQIISGALFVIDADVAFSKQLPSTWHVHSTGIAPFYWSSSLSNAGARSRAVLALTAPVRPCLEALGVMLDLLQSDDMFGAVAPRVQCDRRCCIQTLSGLDSLDSEWMPQSVTGDLPRHVLPGDVLAPALLIGPVVLTEFAETTQPFESLQATLVQRMLRGRRAGFRTAVSNRAAVTVAGADCVLPPPSVRLPRADADRLTEFETDSTRSWQEFRGESAALFERLTCRQLAVRAGARPSLLLDLRNLGDCFNGTSFAALGSARGLLQAGADWDIAILANERGAEFHDLGAEFPSWPVYTSLPRTTFNVALRLSQPWHIQEMVDLHRIARQTSYLMLDTIAWDTVYIAPRNLDGTWQTLAQTADSLLFISDFSRQRFQHRFPVAEPAVNDVCHLSFDPQDYIRPELADCPESDYVLIVGNHLEHKDVAATAELLASAFPLMRIETLGPAPWQSSTMVSHKSGQLADADVHRLYAAARLVIFPSFYEGFGLPVVTALAYGRTLIARQSRWLDEIAASCVPNGRLVTFHRRDDLVGQVERLLDGGTIDARPLGTALEDGRVRSWRDVGIQIDQSLRGLLSNPSLDIWNARAQVVAQVEAYR